MLGIRRIQMSERKVIPAEVFRYWANCFADGTLEDDYAPELAELLMLLSANAEFNTQMRETYGGDFYDTTYH